MESRALLAVVLSIAVFYVFSSYIMPPPPKQQSAKVSQQLSSAHQTPSVQTAAQIRPPVLGPVVANAAARDIEVDTELYHATFSTRGASLKRLILKKYHENTVSGGKEIVLVGDDAPENYSLITDAKGISVDPSAIYTANADTVIAGRGETKDLEFSWISPQGIMLRKKYQFQGGSYAITLTQQVQNGSAAHQDGTVELLLNNRSVPRNSDTRFEQQGPVTLEDGSLKAPAVKDLAKGPLTYAKSVSWTGFNDKYFLGAVLADNGTISTVTVSERPGGRVVSALSFPRLSLAPGQTGTLTSRLYFGPKDLDILKAQGNNLERAIDLGWFQAIAKPLLHTLKFFYRFFHNYGIAIIIITVILKVLFYPLTYKSYKSMKEMQKLQPKMQALKEKHKNDRDAMNRAIMELYKTHKVNPMGGCLPMIVQIPVFFALYKSLMFSIELRQAPFIFWITDLSAKDPYYVTPLIMGATMFIQQKMTPNAGMDPTQAKMMLMLPVIFTFMFLNFPSGLVLYWLVNNILTIGQQYYINKKLAA